MHFTEFVQWGKSAMTVRIRAGVALVWNFRLQGLQGCDKPHTKMPGLPEPLELLARSSPILPRAPKALMYTVLAGQCPMA